VAVPSPFVCINVVMRVALVVSALGGGGSDDRSGIEGRIVARQRKHSPVP
jgi:hypothetical protein